MSMSREVAGLLTESESIAYFLKTTNYKILLQQGLMRNICTSRMSDEQGKCGNHALCFDHNMTRHSFYAYVTFNLLVTYPT